jgi:hypothetical protein
MDPFAMDCKGGKRCRHAPPCRRRQNVQARSAVPSAVKRCRHAPPCRPPSSFCQDSGWTAHGMCLLLWVDGTWNVPTTLSGRHMGCAYYFTFCRLVRSYKRNIGKVAFFECNQCLRSKGHSVAWSLAPLSDNSILHVKVGKLIQKRQCLHCVFPNSCKIIKIRFVSASGMLRIRLVQT